MKEESTSTSKKTESWVDSYRRVRLSPTDEMLRDPGPTVTGNRARRIEKQKRQFEAKFKSDLEPIKDIRSGQWPIFLVEDVFEKEKIRLRGGAPEVLNQTSSQDESEKFPVT